MVRMLLGSLVVRIWSVLIVGALTAVAVTRVYARFAWLAVFMTIAFWMVDAHFLRQARLFRKTRDLVQTLPESVIDFSLDTSRVDGEAEAFRTVVFSRALVLVYGSLIAAIAAVRIVVALRR